MQWNYTFLSKLKKKLQRINSEIQELCDCRTVEGFNKDVSLENGNQTQDAHSSVDNKTGDVTEWLQILTSKNGSSWTHLLSLKGAQDAFNWQNTPLSLLKFIHMHENARQNSPEIYAQNLNTIVNPSLNSKIQVLTLKTNKPVTVSHS